MPDIARHGQVNAAVGSVGRLAGRRAATVIAMVLVALHAPRTARAGDDAPDRRDAVAIVVGPAEAEPGLAARLVDVVGTDWSPERTGGLRVETASRFFPEQLFEMGDQRTARPAVWLVIDGATARVRAASADRQRFVFRDLVVAQPLTDLDRERIAHTAKAALATVVAGGTGALDPGAARGALGVPPASRGSPSPAKAPPAERPSRFKLSLGGFLEVARVRSSFGYGPGAVTSLQVEVGPVWVGPWTSLMAFQPHGIPTNSPAASYGVAWRAGVTVGPARPTLSWAHLDLGVGYDWVRPLYTGGGQQKIPTYRLAARVGPAALTAPLAISGAFFFEFARESIADGDVVAGVRELRPGLAVELWWL